MAATSSVENLLWLPQGQQFPVVRPYSLATNWTFQIVDDVAGTVMDFSTVAIPNATRHQLVAIDSRYSLDTDYRIDVYNNVPAVVASGHFQIVRGVFDSVSSTNLEDINDQLRLALGLARLNSSWVVNTRDSITGDPTSMTCTIYTDETMTSVLARYELRRRFNDVRQVIGEVMWQSYINPSSTSTSTGTGTGS